MRADSILEGGEHEDAEGNTLRVSRIVSQSEREIEDQLGASSVAYLSSRESTDTLAFRPCHSIADKYQWRRVIKDGERIGFLCAFGT